MNDFYGQQFNDTEAESNTFLTNDDVLDNLIILLGLQYERYLRPRNQVLRSQDFYARCIPQLSFSKFQQLFRMDPNDFEKILEMIVDHEQFNNNFTMPQAPVLLQLMVALY